MQSRGFITSVALCALTIAVTAIAAAPGKDYVGSERCKNCHVEEYQSWKESFHSRIVRDRKSGILKDAVAKWATDGKTPGPSTGNVTGAKFKLDDVRYIIGSRWKQRYLVANDKSGGMQFLDRQFNRLTGQWEEYGDNNDWDTSCASCHTTGYRITEYDEKSDKTVKSEFSELSIGCEACHGPGAAHVKSRKKKDIIDPANMSVKDQSKFCGHCHVQLENRMYKTAQGNPREDLPAPKIGESYLAGDDWTSWYPEQVSIPGVQPSKPFSAEYSGNLKGLFKTDAFAKANGIFEESRNHQQYQGFLQSKHYKSGKLSCITCHSPHAGWGKLKKVPRDACKSCHDASYTVEKYMPNTGETAHGLFVRTHTFGKNPRKGGKGAADIGVPNYYK